MLSEKEQGFAELFIELLKEKEEFEDIEDCLLEFLVQVIFILIFFNLLGYKAELY
jgi:hypothetical protein